MALEGAMIVAELRQRLPRLLFAAYDRFPLAGGVVAGAPGTTGITRVPILAVRSMPVKERLDEPVATALSKLVEGQLVQEAARSLEFDITPKGPYPGDAANTFHITVCWHDALDFVALLLRGNPSCVEAVSSFFEDSGEPALFLDPDFTALIESIREAGIADPNSFNAVLKGKSYLMACAGPAMSLVRPPKKASSVAQDLHDNSVVLGLCKRVAAIVAPDVLKRIEELDRRGELSKAEWHSVVQDLMEQASKCPTVKSAVTATALNSWVDELREREFASFAQSVACVAVESDTALTDTTRVALDSEWQERLASMWPTGAELVFMAQTGSFMYNVNVASSDCDYSVIFMSQPENLCRREPPSTEFSKHVHASFGADKRGEVEYSGKELGTFLLELSKGNPRNIELLFTNKPHVSGAIWEELRAMRRQFLTVRCASQYLGFIYDRLNKAKDLCAESAKEESFPQTNGVKISKLFYHAYHKIFELARVLAGGDPVVALVDEERSFVLNLRQQPPQQLSEASAQVAEIETRWCVLRDELEKVRHEKSLPLEVDPNILTTWLRSVRVRQTISNQASPMQDLSTPSSPPALMRHRTQCDNDAITAILDELEVTENIRIIHAAYGPSSRTMGTAHEGSDHDVKFIFTLQRTEYLGLRPPATALKRTFPASGGMTEVEVSGWEARHACRMLADCNPTVLHVLHSPVVFKTTPWAGELQSLANKALNKPKLAVAWAKHGKENYRQYIASVASPIRKKYVHVLRPLLCLAWLTQNCSEQPPAKASDAWPPAELMEMAQQVSLKGGLSDAELKIIAELVLQRELLPCALPHDGQLDALIERLLKEETFGLAVPYEGIGTREKRELLWHELCGAMIDATSSF